MIVSPDILRKELLSLMAQIDEQLVEVERTAETFGVKPTQVRDGTGNWVMIPLLVAKVTALSTLTQLNQQEKDRRTTNTKKRRENGY